MLAVTIKFVCLISVLSWYSTAIFTMINEYFRNEFNEYIKASSTALNKISIKNDLQIKHYLYKDRYETYSNLNDEKPIDQSLHILENSQNTVQFKCSFFKYILNLLLNFKPKNICLISPNKSYEY